MFGRLVFWDYIDPDVQKLLEFDGFGSMPPKSGRPFVFWVAENIYAFWLIMSIASWIGLWFLQRWGRDLLVLLYFLSNVVAPFSGVKIGTPIEQVLMTIFTLSDGIIIGLTYFAWPNVLKRTDQ